MDAAAVLWKEKRFETFEGAGTEGLSYKRTGSRAANLSIDEHVDSCSIKFVDFDSLRHLQCGHSKYDLIAASQASGLDGYVDDGRIRPPRSPRRAASLALARRGVSWRCSVRARVRAAQRSSSAARLSSHRIAQRVCVFWVSRWANCERSEQLILFVRDGWR